MSEDDYDTVPPPKIKELPKGWVLKFDKDDDPFYYNRSLRVTPRRTPIDASEFKTWKIKVSRNCILRIDNEGDPYYTCIIKGKQESSRTAPVSMNELFPYGIELLLTPPFYKELDENKKVTIEKPEQKEQKEQKVKTDLSAYLAALAKGIHCDENTPCDDKDHECDLENKMCVPKSDKSYYDDLKRHEEDGASFVGKSATIQKLIDSITSKKQKKEEDDKKAAKAAKKQKKEEEEKAAQKKREEEEKAEKAAKKKKDDEKASKKKQQKRDEEEEEEEDEKEAEAEPEDEDELNVDDVLDPDYENLSALQKALMDCLVPK